MKATLIEALAEYFFAHKRANDGMSGNWATIHDSENRPCTPQLARFHDAEELLLKFNTEDAPQELKEYAEAIDKRACARCLLSSARIKRHPECDAAINNHFAKKNALLAYAGKMALSLEEKFATYVKQNEKLDVDLLGELHKWMLKESALYRTAAELKLTGLMNHLQLVRIQEFYDSRVGV